MESNQDIDDIDPAGDLALLDRAKRSVASDALDFGPWWYAPLVAVMVGGLTVFSGEMTSATRVVCGVIALAAGLTVAVHDYRRRGIRTSPSIRRTLLLLPATILTFAVLASWGTAQSSIGADRFFPGYALVGWALTTSLLLAIRAGLQAIRQRRTAVL